MLAIPIRASKFLHLAATNSRALITTSASASAAARSGSHIVERIIPVPSHAVDDAAATTAHIHVVQAGRCAPKDAARTVLLMPGALGSAWTDFRPQLEQLPALLPDNWSVVAWDPPGYGRSTVTAAKNKTQVPRQFPVDFFQRDARLAGDLMTTGLGCERFSVLGWSDGGITGMVLAADRPQVVDQLVVWGANSYVLPEELKIYESIRDVQKWSPKMREPLEKLYGVEGFARLWGDWIDGLQRIAKENGGDICREDLKKITCRTLVVHGVKDPMIAAEHVPFLLKHIRQSEYFEFVDGKHNAHLRYAEEFNRVVSEFLLKEK